LDELGTGDGIALLAQRDDKHLVLMNIFIDKAASVGPAHVQPSACTFIYRLPR
jgi:hypothetical protein